MKFPRVWAAAVALLAMSSVSAQDAWSDDEIRSELAKKTPEQPQDVSPARLANVLVDAKLRMASCTRAGGKKDAEECKVAMAALRDVLRRPEPAVDDAARVSPVLKTAIDAQDAVDKLREKAKDAYDRGDRATAIAMDLPSYESMGFEITRANAKLWAERAQSQPAELKRAVRAAQAEADQLVRLALERRTCGADQACLGRTLLNGEIAKEVFDRHVKRATEANDRLSEAEFGLAAVREDPNIRETPLKNDIAFRKLLNDNPDVKSFFGGDAAGVSAGPGAADSTVAFRIVKDFKGSSRTRMSFIVTAPTNKDKSASFINSADAFKNLASVRVALQRTNKPFELLGLGPVNDFAVGLTAAQDSRSYYLVDANDPTMANKHERNFSAVGLGIRWALLFNPASDYKTLLLFGYDRQRSYVSDPSEVRCRPPSTTPALLNCYEGIWGEPVKTFSSVLGMEVRQHTPAFDVGLKLKHNRKTEKLDVEIPLYLTKLFDTNKEKTPYSAGISLSRSTGDKGLTWALFVSTPLQFSKPDR
jgi:hypothetical protein